MLIVAMLMCVFPPIGILALLAYIFIKDHGQIMENIYNTVIMIMLCFAAIAAPIGTAIIIVTNGVAAAFDSFGVGFAITIFEAHLLLYFAWKTEISKRLRRNSNPRKSKPRKSICNNHQVPFVIGVFGYIALLLAMVFDDSVNGFFPTIFFLYGVAFLFWDLAAE